MLIAGTLRMERKRPSPEAAARTGTRCAGWVLGYTEQTWPWCKMVLFSPKIARKLCGGPEWTEVLV